MITARARYAPTRRRSSMARRTDSRSRSSGARSTSCRSRPSRAARPARTRTGRPRRRSRGTPDNSPSTEHHIPRSSGGEERRRGAAPWWRVAPYRAGTRAVADTDEGSKDPPRARARETGRVQNAPPPPRRDDDTLPSKAALCSRRVLGGGSQRRITRGRRGTAAAGWPTLGGCWGGSCDDKLTDPAPPLRRVALRKWRRRDHRTAHGPAAATPADGQPGRHHHAARRDGRCRPPAVVPSRGLI